VNTRLGDRCRQVFGMSAMAAAIILSTALNSDSDILSALTWARPHPWMHCPVIWKRAHKGAIRVFLFFLGIRVSGNRGQALLDGERSLNRSKKFWEAGTFHAGWTLTLTCTSLGCE